MRVAVAAFVLSLAARARAVSAVSAAPAARASDAASPAVFQGVSAGGSGVVVYADDSYDVLVGGTAWLSSAPSQFRISGAWYSSAAAATAPTCTTLPDTDCHGGDLFYFSSTSAAECCANCSATPACGAWTLTGVTAAQRGAPPPWADRCYIKSDCSGREGYAGHTSGVPPGALPQPLLRLGAGAVAGGGAGSGEPYAALGAYSGWRVRYAANVSASTLVEIWATTKFYADSGLVLFEATFPGGALGVNLTAPVNSTSASSPHEVLREFASSLTPATQFPALRAADAAPAGAGYVSWLGRMLPSIGSPTGGIGAALAAAANGAEGGPIVLFDAGAGNAALPNATPALVLAPFAHFKGAQLGPLANGVGTGAAGGVSGYVTALPANHTAATAIFFGAAGVTDVMHGWGATLLSAYATPARIADPSAEALTYWTDNGAYYDFYAYEPNITSAGVPEAILGELAETFRNGSYSPPLPVKAYMLDAYWMYNTRANGNCKMNDSVWPLPFPSGLLALTESVQAPLIIYNGPQCGNTTYGADWPLVFSLFWNQGWGSGVLSAVAADSSLAHYTELFANLSAAFPLMSFTQDFLDFQGLLFPDFLVSPDGNAGWMRGQAEAALARNLALQYCMALPSDVLQSSEFAAVTNFRASEDYGAGGSNWLIGGSSLLLSSLALRASKDNLWSTSAPTPRGREGSPYLIAIAAALSRGPFGFADPLGGTDAAVLWPAMTLNGTLLHASRPATSLDAQFAGTAASSPLSAAAGDVRAAHAAISTTPAAAPPLLFYSILAARAPAAALDMGAALRAADLWPLPPPGAAYVLWQWNTSACAAAGAPAGDCVTALGGGGGRVPAPPPPPPDATPWALWSAAPRLPGGWVLLGEADKYVPASPRRFRSVAAGAGIALELAGAPAEVVRVSYIRPGGTIAVAVLTLGGDGTLSTTVQ